MVLEETALALSDALTIMNIDHECFRKDDIPITDHTNVYIIVGIHHYTQLDISNLIIIQTEQPGSTWFKKGLYEKLIDSLGVWDFSPRLNKKWLDMGVNSHYVPIRIPMDLFVGSVNDEVHFSGIHKDIDVLFYGGRHRRRVDLERKIKKTFPKKKIVFRYYDLFGEERENFIARSKIVLNTHFWTESSLETHRIEYLLARGKCVISEGSMDVDLDEEYSSAVVFCKYEEMVKMIKRLLGNPHEIKIIENLARQLSETHQFDMSYMIKALTDCIGKINKSPGVSQSGSIVDEKEEMEPIELTEFKKDYIDLDDTLFEIVA